MRCLWLFCGVLLFALAPPAAAADPPSGGKKGDGKVYQIPYKLTTSQHIMVRMKINGKGPYNFIVDTGAPMLFVAVPVAKKAGLTADEKRMATINKLEIEGGPVFTKFQCRVETPFQLEGMNAMSMAGTELHGMMGYTVLAHFRMEIDLRRDKMAWTRLDYTPSPPMSLGIDKENKTLKDLDNVGSFIKAYAKLLGKGPPPPPLPRGFLGIELTDSDKQVTVKHILAKSPADGSGLKVGDRILLVNGKEATTLQEVMARAAQVTAGQTLSLTVQRGSKKIELKITAGEGL